MATAAELLAGILDRNAHEHPVIDDDTYFVIDPDTRVITNAANRPVTLMQYDHASERFTFELPRYVDGHDMTLCNRVYVHFNNVDSVTGEEHADVAEIYDLGINNKKANTVTCSWLVLRAATQYAGSLSFLVQYQCVDDDGDITYVWQSDIFTDAQVKPGRNNESVVSEYSHVLEQWRESIFGAYESVVESILDTVDEHKSNAVSDIENKADEVLASIPPDYATAFGIANEAYRTKADAIICSVEGDDISVSDASNDNIRGLKVFGKTTQITTTGKNLLEIPDTLPTTKGVTFTVNSDRSITANGTATEVMAVSLYGTYTEPIAFPVGSYIVSGGVDANHVVRVRIHQADGTIKSMKYADGTSKTFDVVEGDLVSVSLYFLTLEHVSDIVFKPMIRLATVEDETFEPYSAGVESPSPDRVQEIMSIENPTINIRRKNFLTLPYVNGTSRTHGGLTYTVRDDGSIHVKGTVTAAESYFVLSNYNFGPKSIGMGLSNGKYIWSDCLYNVANNNTLLYFNNGNVVDKVYYPQVELGTVATSFESPKPLQSITINRSFRGVPVRVNGNYIDENGQHWVCDEVDFERGVYIQRVYEQDVTFYGVEYGDDIRYNADLDYVASSDHSGVVVCDSLPFNGSASVGQRGVRVAVTTPKKLVAWYDDKVLGTAKVVYILAEPIETKLTASEIEEFRNIHTNFPNTAIHNDANVWMALTYNADTAIYIDRLPKATDEQVRDAVIAWLNENFTGVSSNARIGEVELLASAWTGSGNRYSQVVPLDGITENTQVDLTPSVEQLEIFYEKDLTFVTENDGGVLTVYAIGQKPTNDYTIQVTMTEVIV